MKVIKRKERKEKIRIKESTAEKRSEKPKGSKIRIPFRKKAAAAGNAAVNDSFGANVQSDEPILVMKDVKEQAAWTKDLVLNCSCALLVTTALALFCMSISSPELILCVLPCAVIFMIIATIGSVLPGVIRWLAAGAVSIILIIAAIIWKGPIFDGIGTLINWFFDAAEEAQAYVYDRLPVDGASDGAMRGGLAWASCVVGMVTALPPAKFRRAFSALVAIVIMIALAYYGLMPSAVCIAVMIAALIAAVSRGNILSFLPVALAALLLFGAIVLVDPGENYAVSRINENLRDRFALNSALLQTNLSPYNEPDFEDLEDDWSDGSEDEESDGDDTGEYGKYAVIGIIILAVAALGAGAFLLIRRFLRKRAQNRKGINSDDAREAVTALFPYAVRWLKGYGIEQPDPSFASMEPALEKEFTDEYSNRFMDMYNIWNEAAYSDHDVTEESRVTMEDFIEDTVDRVYKKCKLKDKLRLRLRLAL